VVRSFALAAVAAFLTGCADVGVNPQSLATRDETSAGVTRDSDHHCRAWPGGSGILVDGDFSQAQKPSGAHATFSKGAYLAAEWKVTRGSIDLQSYGSDAKPPHHVCSVDLDGWSVGAIEHDAIPTTASTSYTVTFLFSGNGRSNCPADEPPVKTMSVRAAGQAQRFTWDTSNGNNAENGDFAPETWTFAAIGPMTKLAFVSLDGTKKNRNFICGPVVAAVSVSQT
jgi:hypothetical protein